MTSTICNERSASKFRDVGCSAVIPFSAKVFLFRRARALASQAPTSIVQSVRYS